MFDRLVHAHAELVEDSYDEEWLQAKLEWRRAGGIVARRLAEDLGGTATFNAGGHAVAGDHTLLAPNVYLQLCGMHYPWGSVMYRRATPEDKYGTRSENQWAHLPCDEAAYQDLLAKLRALASTNNGAFQ